MLVTNTTTKVILTRNVDGEADRDECEQESRPAGEGEEGEEGEEGGAASKMNSKVEVEEKAEREEQEKEAE